VAQYRRRLHLRCCVGVLCLLLVVVGVRARAQGVTSWPPPGVRSFEPQPARDAPFLSPMSSGYHPPVFHGPSSADGGRSANVDTGGGGSGDAITDWMGAQAAAMTNSIVGYVAAYTPAIFTLVAIVAGIGLIIGLAMFLARKV